MTIIVIAADEYYLPDGSVLFDELFNLRKLQLRGVVDKNSCLHAQKDLNEAGFRPVSEYPFGIAF